MRHQQGPDKTCILGCYDRAWHCLLPCLVLSRSQLGISTANLLHYYQPGIQAFPWTHTSQAAAYLPQSLPRVLLHRTALHCVSPFRWLGSKLENSHSCTLSCLKPLALCSIQFAPVKSSYLSDLLDLSEPGWTVQVHLHTLQTTVDVSTATMTTTTLPLAKEAPLPL